MTNNQLSQILTYVLIAMAVVLAILIIIFLKIYFSERKRKNELKKKQQSEIKQISKKATTTKQKHTSQQEKGNVLDFMEFDDVADNMIIKKEREKYLMVIECQGVNYDLMSGVEKNGVEQGFLQFLNTLRHPIQLYVQTRAINLEGSIEKYKQYLKNIEREYNKKLTEYERVKNDRRVPEETKQKMFYELTKTSNLYEYGKDIIEDTERISLNNNILNKKYYIVVAYYQDTQSGETNYSKDEIRNMAFSDLYSKCQTMIRTLSATGVRGKILNSIQLVELLYMAYNRESAENYGIERALKASYDKIYSTAPDIFTKRMKELDKEIEKEAIELAQNELEKAKSEKELELERKESQKEKIIEELAKVILEQNKKYVGKDIAEKAIKNIEEKSKEEGGSSNEEEQETTANDR